MASGSGEINPSGQNDEAGKALAEDAREGKKKKFRPFEAVRKFFKGSKKGVKSDKDVVAGKSRSLQMINQEESDDDGGFRKKLPMGGSRSMSEDSVFHPEAKETKMDAVRKTAISMESLNTDFQSELAGKLKKRYSLYNSEDEGLAQSPTPPISTADIVMGSSLKHLSGTAKSTSKESDVGIESSETEEDDLFRTDWSKSVASVCMRKPSVQSLPDTSAMDLDLSAISKEASSTLKNDAARHRISLKPKRRPSGIRKTREQRASASSPLPLVKEESPSKSDVQLSPVTPEPLSPKSPIIPVSPKPLSPLSPKTDLFPKLEEKVPEQKSQVQNITEVSEKEDHKVPEVSKKPDEHKTVIAIGQDTSHYANFGAIMKSQEERPPMKSMSLDRKMNYNLSDYSKPTDKPTDDIRQIAKISRQRPKSLHDSVPPSVEEDSELSKTFNKMKRNSLKDTDTTVPADTKKDTGFYLVGSLKRNNDIPFGARRPENKSHITPFNEGISSKPTDAKSDLVKSPVSPTKQNFTYVLKKEPLKSQTSGEKKDLSPTKSGGTMETKLDITDSQKVNMRQKSSESNKEPVKQFIIESKGADKYTKDPKSNYENVILPFESGSQKKSSETKESEKIVIESTGDKKDGSNSKGRSSGYDNITIITKDDGNKLTSPREDYKLKRQSRSRTLPEQPVSADLLASKTTNRKDSLTHSFKFKEDSVKSETIIEKPETKPVESKANHLSRSMNASHTTGTEPTWMKMAKKRQEEAKEKEGESRKDMGTSRPAYTGARISSLSESTKDKNTPKSVFTSGLGNEPSREKALPKVSEPVGFKSATRSSVKGSSSVSAEVQKDTIVTKPPLPGVGSENKDGKVVKNIGKKTDIKSDEKVSAASALKSTNTARNIGIDTPKGWKSGSSLKQKAVKIEIIEKTDLIKPEDTSKVPPVGTTTARKTDEKAPVLDKTVPEKCVDRKSKVLDMVKNFQNLQVS